jgi:hypothetical protein
VNLITPEDKSMAVEADNKQVVDIPQPEADKPQRGEEQHKLVGEEQHKLAAAQPQRGEEQDHHPIEDHMDEEIHLASHENW